jgi:hypothetical protein
MRLYYDTKATIDAKCFNKKYIKFNYALNGVNVILYMRSNYRAILIYIGFSWVLGFYANRSNLFIMLTTQKKKKKKKSTPTNFCI